MFGHKRVSQIEPHEDQPTRRGIEQHLSSAEQTVVEKDLLLIDAALASDRNILSLDERTRRLLRGLAVQVRQLRRLHWVSPNDDGCLDWLAEQSPDDGRFRLV